MENLAKNDLINAIKSLMKNSEIKKLIETRIKEFEKIREGSDEEIFKELCFCILTANFNAEKCIKIQKEINTGFLTLNEEELARELRRLGHRFPNTRARYIVLAREHLNSLRSIVNSGKNEGEIREWLVKNIKGLGYKETSHFLRNIGFKNLAILDFHILNLLEKFGIIEKPKNLSRKKYLEIENILTQIAKKLSLTLAELDLYLWFLETRKVLK